MNAKEVIKNIKKSELVKDFIHKEYPQNNGKEYKTFKVLYSEELPLRSEYDFKRSKQGKPYLKKSTKRVDLAAFVQISDRKFAGVYPLIGFEVKISESDLKNDEKFFRYLPYFDYFFFAIPENLKQAAIEYFDFMDNVGIISVSGKSVKIAKYPVKNNLVKQHEILESFIVKNLI